MDQSPFAAPFIGDARAQSNRLSIEHPANVRFPPEADIADDESGSGPTLTKVYSQRMPDSVAGLRKKAQHCRELANLSLDGPARAELLKMAAEFDGEADKVERKSLPRRQASSQRGH